MMPVKSFWHVCYVNNSTWQNKLKFNLSNDVLKYVSSSRLMQSCVFHLVFVFSWLPELYLIFRGS